VTNYARGAKRENDWAEREAEKGWSVTRSAGSHGAADVVACREGFRPRYWQVKTDKAGPYAHFGPGERRQLLAEATVAGADCFLVWWPPDRQGPRIIPPESWPPS
jgi:Holliday junction resolvase